MEPIPADELAEATKLRNAIESFKVARDDEARNAASVIIQEQLNSQFDRDVAQREKELAEVEQRVKTLREQLEKRKSLRDDIIGLRLKTIQNDAEGLGFPGGDSISGSGRTLYPQPGGLGGLGEPSPIDDHQDSFDDHRDSIDSPRAFTPDPDADPF